MRTDNLVAGLTMLAMAIGAAWQLVRSSRRGAVYGRYTGWISREKRPRAFRVSMIALAAATVVFGAAALWWLVLSKG
jgi:hypothetical protein